jgi:hypothetical protein
MKKKMMVLYRRWCELKDSYVKSVYNPTLVSEIETVEKDMESLCPDKEMRAHLYDECHSELYPHLLRGT